MPNYWVADRASRPTTRAPIAKPPRSSLGNQNSRSLRDLAMEQNVIRHQMSMEPVRKFPDYTNFTPKQYHTISGRQAPKYRPQVAQVTNLRQTNSTDSFTSSSQLSNAVERSVPFRPINPPELFYNAYDSQYPVEPPALPPKQIIHTKRRISHDYIDSEIERDIQYIRQSATTSRPGTRMSNPVEKRAEEWIDEHLPPPPDHFYNDKPDLKSQHVTLAYVNGGATGSSGTDEDSSKESQLQPPNPGTPKSISKNVTIDPEVTEFRYSGNEKLSKDFSTSRQSINNSFGNDHKMRDSRDMSGVEPNWLPDPIYPLSPSTSGLQNDKEKERPKLVDEDLISWIRRISKKTRDLRVNF